MSGATLRLIGEHFDPHRFADIESVEVGQVESTNLAGKSALRHLCILNAPYHGRKEGGFESVLAFFASKAPEMMGAGLSPYVEIADLLISIMVNPLVGASFQFPPAFFAALRTMYSTLSIHFTNDEPKKPVGRHFEGGFCEKYCITLQKANKEPEEADVKLRKFLQRSAANEKLIPVILKLPPSSARSHKTARFNLSHECIQTLATRKLSIKLDVVGSTMGKCLLSNAN